MKKYFFIGITTILLFALALVVYGAYLNYADERKISERLQDNRIEARVKRAQIIAMSPIMDIEAIKLYSDSKADAIALVNGNIVSWHVKKNDYVHKGDLLATLSNEQISLKIQQATSALSRAEASFAQATNAYNRQGRLMARKATSKEKYEEAEAQYNAASAAVQEAKAALAQNIVEKERLKVYAPIDGNVLIIYNNEGAYLQAGAPVALVGNFKILRFSMTINDSEKNNIGLGDRVRLKFSERTLQKAYDTEYAAGNNGFGEDIEATLVDITPPLNEKATMRRIIWEVDNRARMLEPLTYHDVKLINRETYTCLAVPIRALADNKKAVFLVDEDGVVEKRQIKTGASDGVNIEVTEGLKEGDTVVVGNFEGLANGMRVNLIMD